VTQISPHVKTHAFVTQRSFCFTSTIFPRVLMRYYSQYSKGKNLL